MNIVSYGGGTNSTAMLIGMWEKEIAVDLILFADTGAEQPETYDYIKMFSRWLINHNMPEIITVQNVDKYGNRLSLETECLSSKTLPSIAYGFKKCSMKHKAAPQEKFCNNYQPCRDEWDVGRKVIKYIGYDAGEERRKTNATPYNELDKKYEYVYPLIEWEWYREDCVRVIESAGLPLPGKSSCFFCPSMKKKEIRELKKKHPDLFDRAIKIEDNAQDNLFYVKGLGRNYSWKHLIEFEEKQIGLCAAYDPEVEIACGCYDG